MVLSIRVHELLTQNSKNNLIQNDFKSLIPQNDIPDKKQVYHKNMLEISEKTIELKKSKKLFQKKEEIIVDKVEDESDDESIDEFDEEPEEIEDDEEESDYVLVAGDEKNPVLVHKDVVDIYIECASEEELREIVVTKDERDADQ